MWRPSRASTSSTETVSGALLDRAGQDRLDLSLARLLRVEVLSRAPTTAARSHAQS
jgi:hypothetical protein